MSRKRFTPEQIIVKLREAEVVFSQGTTVGHLCTNLDNRTQLCVPMEAKAQVIVACLTNNMADLRNMLVAAKGRNIL